MSSAGTGTGSKSRTNLRSSFWDRSGVFALLRPFKLLPAMLPFWMSTDKLCAAMWACISASALLSAAASLSGLPSPASTPLWLLPLLLRPLWLLLLWPFEAAAAGSTSDSPAASVLGPCRRPSCCAWADVSTKNDPSVSALRTHWRFAVRRFISTPPVLQHARKRHHSKPAVRLRAMADMNSTHTQGEEQEQSRHKLTSNKQHTKLKAAKPHRNTPDRGSRSMAKYMPDASALCCLPSNRWRLMGVSQKPEPAADQGQAGMKETSK